MFTIIWIISGFAGWVFFWTKKHDLKFDSACGFLFLGLLMGPISWGVAWMFMGDSSNPTIMKRR